MNNNEELPLQKNQIRRAVIEGWSSEAQGVCRIGGRAVFVTGALPGETWDVRILKVTAGAVWARGETLLVPSPSRRVPDCPHFGVCGGCDTRHMTYDEELRFKLRRVNDALSHIGRLDFRIETILGSQQTDRCRHQFCAHWIRPPCAFSQTVYHARPSFASGGENQIPEGTGCFPGRTGHSLSQKNQKQE